ncbi:acyl CoA:acetate/3-ketoacid CoA transferase [Paenibacillus cymbidii]|uniref:acyl CoA:acetate/3-ketoacid CoA transferase n=1 Tax=Paenibacillus cymbidii TaxID=1639034 RepID=UPI001081EA5E|nr:CoA-transferase [Paenibacillus cymbidii]
MNKKPVVTADEAVAVIQSGWTVSLEGGSGGLSEPEQLFVALEKRFLATGSPRSLTFVHSNGMGNGKDKSIAHIAHEGLVKRIIGGHYGMTPLVGEFAANDKCEAYNFPQGVIAQLYREIAGRRPGLVTHVGLHTFVDPRLEGGKLNRVTTEELVELTERGGKPYLFYPSLHLDAVFLRGTTADEYGNISCEEEAAYLNGLAAAQAVKACGGIVIAQVKRIAKAGTLDSRTVKIPGIFVDYLVVDGGQTQTYAHAYDPSLNGSLKAPEPKLGELPLDERKIVCRRAAMELRRGAVVNLGYGMSADVATVAAEEGIGESLTFAVEQGAIGGVPISGILFGTAINPQAVLDAPAQFDFFDSGRLDISFLGMAQMNAAGDVNVSKFGPRIVGCGGFINITQNSKKVVFCFSFTAGGLKIGTEQGRLRIEQEGKHKKFVPQIDQVTFAARMALQSGQEILYVTERAVFDLTPDGIRLIEIAPGVDLEKDVLGQMDVVPLVSPSLKLMDAAIFRDEPLGLAERLVGIEDDAR